MYENHSSILKIKECVHVENKFTFTNSTSITFGDEINQLDPKKAGIDNDLPTKILIGGSDRVSSYLSNIYNNSKNDNMYPQKLKLADVTPIHKKNENNINEKL